MGTPYGPSAASLSALTQGIRAYSLFQAVSLVVKHLHHAHPDLSTDDLYELLEFQANPCLGFPRSDVDSIEFFHEGGLLRARMRLNFLGLVGSSSPLPAFYGEQASGGSETGNLTISFLDVFHHRLQRLIVPIWRKYRYHASFELGASDCLSSRLFALIGLGGKPLRLTQELNWKRLLPYLGLLSLRAHSAALIEAVLRYYFKHTEISLEQCVERRVEIVHEQRTYLGLAHTTLGRSVVLGQRVPDRRGKFRIHIRNLDWQRFHDFLPAGPGYQPLCALVRFTLRDPLDYDIRLVLRHEQIRQLHVGRNNECRLGWSSWLGSEHAEGVVNIGRKFH